jgi:glycosyltransferase involved in cell wall biosynthesis
VHALTLRALVVSYAFPPVGGAGVQRMLKLVKYLPEHDVRPSVLTSLAASAPVTDPTLLAELPGDLDVMRARTLEPNYGAKERAWQAAAATSPGLRTRATRALVAAGRRLLLPDPQVLWLPAAAWALVSRLHTAADDVVLISGPPFSQFLLTLLVTTFAKKPVVLDYRDEWTTTSSVYEMSGSSRAGAALERAVLRRAAVVTTATAEFRERLLERFDFLDPERVIAIPNGYDPADFPAHLPAPPNDRCVLSYTGTVFRLTSARGFLDGVRLFHERDPELARLLSVRFIGRIVETEAAAFEGTEKVGVSRLGYLEHGRALAELSASHVALCLLDAVDGAERIYPAKIFEIMRLGRRCLALTPEGALARLVREHQVGDVVPPRDAAAIAAALDRLVRDFRSGKLAEWRGPVDVERFDRRRQAGDFARALALGVQISQAAR